MSNKIFKNILIGLVLVTVILGPMPFGVEKAKAVECDATGNPPGCTITINPNPNPTPNANWTQSQKEQIAAGKTDVDELQCIEGGLSFKINFDACAAKFLYYVVVIPSSWVLWFAGTILNLSVDISLSGSLLNGDFIKDGWAVCRDLANMFFIFIILFIAISIILQLSQYGSKQLLIKVVIIALLINFSLLISGFIIDASNILASSFYEKLNSYSGGNLALTADNGISAIFVNAFNPQKLLGEETFIKWRDEKGAGQSLVALIILFLVASIVILVASFILFAGAILFVIRIVLLSILMILAPLAFLFMAVPGLGGYASQWWRKLFEQAFFAPAFLFLFYLAAMMVNSDFYKGVSRLMDSVTQGKDGMTGFLGAIGAVVLPFIIVAIFMICCLVIAKQMGAMGAGTVMGWGDKMKKGAQGYAGKIPGRTARRMAAPLAEKVATSSNWAARAIRTIPGVTRGTAAIAAAQRKKVEDIQKDYTKYSTPELRNMVSMTSKLKPLTRTAIMKELSGRNALKTGEGLKAAFGNEESRLKDHRIYMKRYGMTKELTDFDKLRPDIIDENTETGKDEEGKPKWRGVRDKALAKANWENMDKDTVKKIFSDENPHKENDTNAIIKGSTSSAIKKLVEDVGGKAEADFFDALKKLGNTVEDIADKLASKDIGNYSLASWVRSGPGRPIMNVHGIESKEKEEKPEQEKAREDFKKLFPNT